MNIKFRIILSVLFLINTLAYGQGVKFEFMTLKESIDKAKKENKIVFLHKGEHCGYGIRSIKTLENSQQAGDFFNKHFINVRPKNESEIDAIFSNSYSPIYYFISPDEEVLMMIGSEKKPEKLIKLGKKILKGKIIKPNWWGLYTAGMYPKNKKTLKMLSYSMQAHLILNLPDSIYADTTFNIRDKIQVSDIENCRVQLLKSLNIGEYYYNRFLLALIYYKSGEKKNSKELAQNIMDKYPHKDYLKSRTMTDNFLTGIIERE
jgi:hypothetical protein